MGTPEITAAITAHGVEVTITNPATAATDASSFELWRTADDEIWRGRHSVGLEGSWLRLGSSDTGNDTFLDTTPESGVTYSYRVRVIGNDMSTADSLVVEVSDFALDPGVYLIPAALAVQIGTEVDETKKFRMPQPGAALSFESQSSTHLFAGRRYPVVEFGLHDLSQLEVTVKLLYSETTEGFGSEMDLLLWERNNTVLLYRDARGVKAYGVIRGLATKNAQWGREATFTIQPVDYDDTVAA